MTTAVTVTPQKKYTFTQAMGMLFTSIGSTLSSINNVAAATDKVTEGLYEVSDLKLQRYRKVEIAEIEAELEALTK